MEKIEDHISPIVSNRFKANLYQRQETREEMYYTISGGTGWIIVPEKSPLSSLKGDSRNLLSVPPKTDSCLYE